MRKIRIFVVLLALALVAAACGTDEPVAEEPAAEEPAEEEEPLRIGLVLPDLAIPIFQIMVEAAEARAEELGVILLSPARQIRRSKPTPSPTTWQQVSTRSDSTPSTPEPSTPL